MSTDFANLASEGYPDYDLYEEGYILNTHTKQKLKPNKDDVVTLYNHQKSNAFSVPKLVRKYFDNAITRLPSYMVCNLKFCGLSKYSVCRTGQLWSHINHCWIDTSIPNQNGYVQPRLVSDDGKSTTYRLHKLVALAFVANPYHYDQIDHKDGNKLNNSADNLEWVSIVENLKRARLKGLKPQAITDEEVHKACQMINDGYTDSQIARVCNTYPQIITTIRKGYTHCEISSQYGIQENRIRNRKIDYSKYKKDPSKYKHYTPKESTAQ